MRAMTRKLTILLCCFCCVGAVSVAHAKYPIAGVKPYARPDGAPMIQMSGHHQGWFERAMTGVEKPYPQSLGFIKNQGNWYTPFVIPGMQRPYDIRGWHK